jgi:hypothetical protein
MLEEYYDLYGDLPDNGFLSIHDWTFDEEVDSIVDKEPTYGYIKGLQQVILAAPLADCLIHEIEYIREFRAYHEAKKGKADVQT